MKSSNHIFPLDKNEWIFLFFWLLGGVFIYLYLQDIRPEFLNVSVPAVASTYLEQRYFTLVKTNLIDELGFLSFIIGLYILVFKGEKSAATDAIKFKSFLFALKLTLILWVLSYFLFYGYIIFALSIGVFPFFVLVYYLNFKWNLSQV